MTELIRPANLDEALAARKQHPDLVVLSGGTDLLVTAYKTPPPEIALDIFGLEEITGITQEDDGTIAIGAAATYLAIITDRAVVDELPILVDASREVGALQIQSRGTLGGNIGTSSPVGDTLPVLLALDAEIEVASVDGRRRIAYSEYCTGYRTTKLAPHELIVAIRFPPRPAGLRQFWRKIGTRRAQSISKVMVAAAGQVTDGSIEHVRIALGAVANRPIRAEAAEAAAQGQPPTRETALAVRDALAQEIKPITDLRSTADYRLSVSLNVVARFIEHLGE